jgi:hypothetical protein
MRCAWIGIGRKAVFAANIGNICKKINAADRPGQVIARHDKQVRPSLVSPNPPEGR